MKVLGSWFLWAVINSCISTAVLNFYGEDFFGNA